MTSCRCTDDLKAHCLMSTRQHLSIIQRVTVALFVLTSASEYLHQSKLLLWEVLPTRFSLPLRSFWCPTNHMSCRGSKTVSLCEETTSELDEERKKTGSFIMKNVRVTLFNHNLLFKTLRSPQNKILAKYKPALLCPLSIKMLTHSCWPIKEAGSSCLHSLSPWMLSHSRKWKNDQELIQIISFPLWVKMWNLSICLALKGVTEMRDISYSNSL